MFETNTFSPMAAIFSCAATFILITANDAMFAAQVGATIA